MLVIFLLQAFVFHGGIVVSLTCTAYLCSPVKHTNNNHSFMSLRERQKIQLEKSADIATRWIGSTTSLVVHTIIFIVSFSLPLLGLLSLDRMLLVLTTVVSLEAIYLSIFIQMSVNKNSQDIEIIQEDVGEIQEDIDEIQKDVDEIQEGVEEIQEDVDEIQEGVEEMQEEDEEEQVIEKKEAEALASIQGILLKLQSEIETLKKK